VTVLFLPKHRWVIRLVAKIIVRGYCLVYGVDKYITMINLPVLEWKMMLYS